jgi:hypothetical protein
MRGHYDAPIGYLWPHVALFTSSLGETHRQIELIDQSGIVLKIVRDIHHLPSSQ